MDADNDNFYDEIASFMPTPGDYSLDDLDEIIRSTDSHLDASLDLNIFSKSLEENDFDMEKSRSFSGGGDQTFSFELEQQQRPVDQLANRQQNEFNFNFSAFPSPATSHQSSTGDYTSPYETPARTSSTSSVDGDNLNPDDFINFLNDDDIKVDGLTHDTIRQLNQHCVRSTPSPTGSCNSSSGSSTSGIQSDISSIASMPQNAVYTLANEQDQDELSEFLNFRTELEELGVKDTLAEQQQKNGVFRMPISPSGQNDEIKNCISGTTLVPLNLPILPVGTFQPVQSVNVVQGAIIPVQTVPLPSTTPVVNVRSSATINIDSKTLTKPLLLQQPIKVNSNISATNIGTTSAKVTPAPPNTKPKTIFLSSNDFKALMHKMNKTNGAVGPGSKKTAFTNGQMPKIIMKTASGKYITANKMPASSFQAKSGTTESTSAANLTYVSQESSQMATKISKTTSSTIVKHNPHHHSSKVGNTNSRSTAAIAAAARGSLQHSKGCRTEFNMIKGLSEDKIVKKQLRMLKNRESASLSRKKKKEYVERLEYRISNLEKENYSLKGENTSLRSQLMAFAKTCDCKHRNVSEFILNTLNMNEKHQRGATVLSDIDASFLIDEDSSDQSERDDGFPSSNVSSISSRSTTQHVRIAPKPLNGNSSINKNCKHRMNASTVKKNVAVLFAMAFMVTLNVGNFQNYLNKSALENALEATAGAGNSNEGGEPAVAATGRRLLWVPNEHEFNEQHNRSKREADFNNMPPPPLHFLRPVNRTMADEVNGTTTKDEPPIKTTPTIKYGPTAYGNGTNYAQENNMRLARNLHKWIGGNDYLNLTGSGNGIGGRMTQFKFGATAEYEDYDLRVPSASVGIKQKRKILLGSDAPDIAGKKKKYDIDAAEPNSLGLFKPRISEEYLKLFKGIKRQDDTFYVLSFNLDHILLPASAYNKSARPKMSLMLPAGDPSVNGDIILMQIDCEVINTTEIELKSHMIPEKLRPLKYGPNNVRVNPNDVANNETKSSGAAPKANGGGEIHLKREEDSIVKPTAPRTYFMMGPKNQSSAGKGVVSGETVIKKRPTIVKLNANDSVIGSGIMNVRNSTLFTRMKGNAVNSGSTSGFVAATSSDVRKLM